MYSNCDAALAADRDWDRVAKMMAMRTVLRHGDLVALVLREGASPSRSLAGEIQAVDDHGVRLALRHWAIEGAAGLDFFVPWSSITAALVAGVEDDWEAFRDVAAAFQERCRVMP